jgi:hypothetical protein
MLLSIYGGRVFTLFERFVFLDATVNSASKGLSRRHDDGTVNAHVDRRRGERDDDGADDWNHQVAHHIDAAEEDLELLEASVERDERGKDFVGGLGTNVLDGEACDGLEDAHVGSCERDGVAKNVMRRR